MRTAVLCLLLVACGSDVGPEKNQETGGASNVSTGGVTGNGGGATGGSLSTGGRWATGGSLTATGGAPASTGGSFATGGVSHGADAGEDAEHSIAPEAGAGGSEAGAFDAGSTGGIVSTGGTTATGGAPACECVSGACCDGCHMKPAGELCFSGPFRSRCPAETTSSCDNRPRTLLVEYREIRCDGVSAQCDGEGIITKTTNDQCAYPFYCVNGAGTGGLTSICTTCPR